MGFTHTQSANGVATSFVLDYVFRALLAQIGVHATLNNWKQFLVISVFWFRFMETFHATIQPTVGHVHAFFGIGFFARIRRTFIKGHDNVGPNGALNVHYILWAKKVFRAINMAFKGSAFFFNFSGSRK